MRPAVAVYNSPVLPNEPSSRRPVQPLRARPSSPAEPVALRQPTPQPFRAGPRSLAASEWKPCGLLAGDPLESFPSPTGFLTGRERSVETGPCSPQSGTSVQEQAFDPGLGGGSKKGHASATLRPQTVTNPVSPCDSKSIQPALPCALAVVGHVVRLAPPPTVHVPW